MTVFDPPGTGSHFMSLEVDHLDKVQVVQGNRLNGRLELSKD